MRRFVAVLLLLILAVGGAAPAAATAVPTCFDAPATIWGQAGHIVGTTGNDVIVGSDGPDQIRALGGDDLVCGGSGDDLVVGGTGVDFLAGEEGSDELRGEAGNDLLNGEGGFFAFADGAGDVLLGGAGDDVILDDFFGANVGRGGQGRDLVVVTGLADGGSGDDGQITSNLPTSQPVPVPPFSRNPPVQALETCDGCRDGHALGGSGSDRVGVTGGLAEGGSGDDVVEAFFDGDEARGGSGNDRLVGFRVVTLNGGSGVDSCDQQGASDVLISCETAIA